jgi:hypothetical protein
MSAFRLIDVAIQLIADDPVDQLGEAPRGQRAETEVSGPTTSPSSSSATLMPNASDRTRSAHAAGA